MYSNAVTTVSPTYAREALEGGAAGWLRSTLDRPEVRAKFRVRTGHSSLFGLEFCKAYLDTATGSCGLRTAL